MKATLIDSMGTDLSVVNAARVSFGKKSEWEYFGEEYDLKEKDKKLIKYLAKHGHYSPFGHSFASFHIKAPIFVARQLVKHEYLRMNEISRRYVDTAPEFYTPDKWRARSGDKKQGSSDEEVKGIGVDWQPSLDAYDELLARGVAPEQARIVLPLSMYTEWYWSGSLDAFANMCNLRLKEDTQAETRLIAEQISDTMKTVFPHSWKALVNDTD